ncbi:hypothetical protein SAMN06265348_102492 [Pedobacter westerhofensis]|uniref:DsrE/DsrF-like family protein n=1 Tax=Pedobacter westerhofensis TaxID=425512 RepID=A0A521BPA0_9SPHI|nr:hypothetical protein [Pedobacter westerhofensis]SMO48977.1 hypothetical protein SAMN06265348_102492 [Pedobacter westerhofensis]
MKIAYFFMSPAAGISRLIYNILPELENGKHQLNVTAMCFFDENEIALQLDNEIGRRLAKLSKEKNILLLRGETTAMNGRSPAECVVTLIADGEETGCFPDFYSAVGDHKPERLISL